MKTYLTIAIAIIIASLAVAIFGFNYELQKQKKANVELRTSNAKLSQSFLDLSKAFQDIAKQKTYSISLSPNVTNHVSPVFGSAKNLTLQYFFTMDGNKIQAVPDSTFETRRIQ